MLIPPIPDEITFSVIASLVSSLLAWLGGVAYGKIAKKKEFEAAATKFVRDLGAQIENASAAGPEESRINARIIVSTRNDLRQTLRGLDHLLNSEIDQLETEISQEVDAWETIQVLAGKWPTKQAQMKYEIRAMLVKLGLPVSEGVEGKEPPQQPPPQRPAPRPPTPPTPAPQQITRQRLSRVPLQEREKVRVAEEPVREQQRNR